MSAGKRESLLSRRQRVVIWVVVSLLTLWIGAYFVLRIEGSHSDPIHYVVLWTKWAPLENQPIWKQYAPDFSTKRQVKERAPVSIRIPENALPWSVIFHPLQQAEFLITGRRVYFIDHAYAESHRIRIGATAKF